MLISVDNLRWWLSLITVPSDNTFPIFKNMIYNQSWQVQTRLGVQLFGNSIWNSPITSYFFFTNNSTGVRMALCTSWTVMYKYNEWTSTWWSIKTGLTEFETDWITRTRWSFAVYKNIVYMCNWVDKYASYDWANYSEYSAQPKVRYLRNMWNAIYGAGQDSNASTLYWCTANWVNAETLDSNNILVWWDDYWKINWIIDIWESIIVFKNNKIYSITTSWTPTVQPINNQTGWFCNRNLISSDNWLIYSELWWLTKLWQKVWATGAQSLESASMSYNVNQLLSTINTKRLNYCCWFYNISSNLYYYSFDNNNWWINNSTIVYSTLTGWRSEYTYPLINDYWYYIDSLWVYHYLIASAVGWQFYEIESGFNDNWANYECQIKTKEFDAKTPWMFKIYEYIDIIGYKNQWFDIIVDVILDWETVCTTVIGDTQTDIAKSPYTIWSSPLWLYPIWWWWWWLTNTIDIYPYLVRIPIFKLGNKIQFQLTSNSSPAIWTIDKYRINYDKENIEVFPYDNYI